MIIITLLCAYWFNREFKQFCPKINQHVYQDYCQLKSNTISQEEFIAQSKLQSKPHYYAYWLYLLFPIIYFLFSDTQIYIIAMLIVLIYLSLIDYCYYLTDSRYIGFIFLLGIAYLLFHTPENIWNAIFSLFILSLFFIFFLIVTQFIFKKETLGLGDVLLLLSLTPFFQLEKILFIILIACLFGLIYFLYYFCTFQQKLNRLPFIPFITLSVLSTYWYT